MNEKKVKQHHWSYMIMGILLVLTGIYAFVAPGMDMTVLATLFIVGCFVTGIGYIISYSRTKSGWGLAIGIINVLFGLFFVINFWTTVLLVPFIAGIYLLFAGVSEIIFATQVRKAFKTWWIYLIFGILAILLSLPMMFYEMFGIATVAILLGVFLVVTGILSIISFFTNTKEGQGFFSDDDSMNIKKKQEEMVKEAQDKE